MTQLRLDCAVKWLMLVGRYSPTEKLESCAIIRQAIAC